MRYMPLDFMTGLAIDVLVNLEVYVIPIASIQSDRIKQQAPIIVFKIDGLRSSRKQVANDQLDKLTATSSLKYGMRPTIFIKTS